MNLPVVLSTAANRDFEEAAAWYEQHTGAQKIDLMTMTTEKTQAVPMSVRMRRVLAAFKRMPAAEGLWLLVKAGLMSEVEAQEAANRQSLAKSARLQSKARRKG